MSELVQTDPNSTLSADVHLQRLLAEGVEEPWFKSLARSIKETINPPKLPPLELTSKPVAVKDIWGLYGRQKKSFMMSTGFQVALAVLAFTVLSNHTVQQAIKQNVSLVLPFDAAPPPPIA